MDCDSVRVPPNAAKHPSVSVPQASSQLDLTPEKVMPSGTAVGQTGRAHKQSGKNTQGPREHAESLTQPSMNSTARISKQLFDLKERQFDAAAAVAEELEQSEMKRLALAEKVSLSVNVRKEETKYSGLIPVNVEEEALLRKCAPSRAPLSSTVDKRPASIDPDIMEFFSDTFVEETAGLDFDIFDQVEAPVGPSPAPLSHAFGLYSHMQMWQPTGKARTK